MAEATGESGHAHCRVFKLPHEAGIPVGIAAHQIVVDVAQNVGVGLLEGCLITFEQTLAGDVVAHEVNRPVVGPFVPTGPGALFP